MKSLGLTKVPICVIQQIAKFAQTSRPVHVIYIDEFDIGRKNSLLWPSKEFPFPGQVRSSVSISPPDVEVRPQWTEIHKESVPSATITLQKALKMNSNLVEADKRYSPIDPPTEARLEMPLKVKIMKCPLLIKRVVAPHFPNIEWGSNNIFAVNIEYNFDSPSAAQGDDVWQTFVTFFTKVADILSSKIRSQDFWADFVDFKSGMARSCDPSRSFLQHDEELAGSGYKMMQIGLCKAIKDVCLTNLDGKPLTGLLFTDAPHEIIVTIIREIEHLLEIVVPIPVSIEEEKEID